MNYPSLTTLNTISVLIFIGVGVFIFNLIMKKWIGVGWKKSFKIMGGYLLASILIYFIYPYPILADFFESQNLMVADFVIYSAVLFLVFYLIMKKLTNVNLKKSLAIFALMMMVVFPVLGQVNDMTLRFATNFGPLQEDYEKVQNDIAQRGAEIEGDLYFQIGNLSTPIFFWQTGRLFEAIIMID